MKAEYIMQITLPYGGGAEIATSKENAEAAQAKWEEYLASADGDCVQQVPIVIEGTTKAGGITRTVIDMSCIQHISIVEIKDMGSIVPVRPNLGIQ